MVVSCNLNGPRVVTAAVVGSLLVGMFGLTYRILASRQVTPLGRTQLDAGALRELPWQIGDWRGARVSLNETIVDATGADACISRKYSRHNNSELVTLFIGAGTNVNEIVAHRPTGCYRAAGWKLIDRGSVLVPLDNGIELPCIIYQFCRETLTFEKVTVLHYCWADGRYFDKVVGIRAQGWRGLRSVSYAAQVQIVASSETLADDSAFRTVSAFARDSASSIIQLFAAFEDECCLVGLNEPRR